MLSVKAFQIADSLDIRGFKEGFKAEVVYHDSDEIFFKVDGDAYIYVFKYGVVCFLNYPEKLIEVFFKLILPFSRNIFVHRLIEEFSIEPNAKENIFGYNKIEIKNAEANTFRLIMLNVSQSVALDYYSDQTNILLKETNYHTLILEKKGRLDISGKVLIKFIGKTLNLKNRIAENLYIFDSPDETWEDENLNKIDLGLKKTFDLQERFRNIQEGLKIVTENLELFKDIMQYRYSNFMEWIIIILIMVEVLNVLFSKIFK